MSCHNLLKSTKYDVHCSNLALVTIISGVIISLVAFFYPVEWDFIVDPTQSAQENEDRRASQVQIQTAVYVMSLTGVILVTIGGIVSAFLLSKYILLEECVKTKDDQPTAVDVLGLPSLSTTTTDRISTKGNNGALGDGQKRKLVDSDYLQLSGASQQYGSTG